MGAVEARLKAEITALKTHVETLQSELDQLRSK
jgi:hypothetical protein